MGPLQIPAYQPTGYQMIRQIEIENFRTFEKQKISDVRRVNVVVGDNGAGKTTLLEAIFLALASTTELGARYRAFRGLAGTFSGSARTIEEAIWRDFFYLGQWQNREIHIETKGDGEESRSVKITRAPSQLFIPLANEAYYGAITPKRFQLIAKNLVSLLDLSALSKMLAINLRPLLFVAARSFSQFPRSAYFRQCQASERSL
jgi:energy-coupling factor transporter ATP-binding protein EcfA2